VVAAPVSAAILWSKLVGIGGDKWMLWLDYDGFMAMHDQMMETA
jgi:hypothetical protein